MLPFGPYRPDVAETNPAVSRNVRNVNPRRDSQGVSYHPRKGLQVATSSQVLPGEPRGALAAVERSGEFSGYFGTATSLYAMNASFGFAAIGTGYNLPVGHSWGLCQYGDHLIASNTTDGMFEWNIEAGGAVTLVADAPAARIVFPWAEMVLALDCDGDNRLMRNSAPGSYTNWKTKGAGSQEFADGEALMGGGTLNDGMAVVIQRGAVRLLTVTGTERIFRIDKIAEGVGAVSPECVVQAPGTVYFLDGGGFYRVTAQGLEAIGEDKVNRSFLESVGSIEQVSGAYDPERNQVVWRKSPTELLVFDIATGEFVPVLENTSLIVKMSSPALTLEGLSAFGTLDSLPYSLDSAAWKGGRPRLAALDENYRFGFFDGPFLPAEVETATLTDTASMMVTWASPVTDALNVVMTLGVKDRLADELAWKPPARMAASGRVPLRGRGKCLVLRVSIPAGDAWTYLRGIDGLVISKGGPR